MQFINHNGLKPDIDLSFLVSRKISSVHIARFWMKYYLEDRAPEEPRVSIEISGSIILTDSTGKKKVKIEDFQEGGGHLCQLLDLTIEKAERREADGGLLLRMSTGICIEIINNEPKYEAVVIYVGEDAIVG